MRWETLAEGFVTRVTGSGGTRAIAVGPRSVALSNGVVLCSCTNTSALGANDFFPAIHRSGNAGETWTDQGPVWPHLREQWSIFVSISRDSAGRLYLFGTRTPVAAPGESFWSDATQGLKQNELIWAHSSDEGRSWSAPIVIPMPIPGAAEAPGILCCTQKGRWLGPFSPYNTLDPAILVDRSQVIVVRSDDRGKSWRHAAMMRFDDRHSGGAEAWVIELSDGRLLGTAWHLSHRGLDLPNAFALSHDGGTTWQPTQSTGILGQSTALTPLNDGRALFIYNQRQHGKPGVWLAVVRPTDTDFGIEANQIVWEAEMQTQTGTSGGHSEWSDFSFGEPSVAELPDQTLLVTLWCIQPSGSGIRFVKLRRKP